MPPVAVTAADPFVPPLQFIAVVAVLSERTLGCSIVVVEIELHPFASVIVTLYAPAVNEFAEDKLPPDGAQR